MHLAKVDHKPNPRIEYTSQFEEDPHYPITATEFNVNRYTYHIEDSVSDISTWYIDSCKWSISKPSWPIFPSDDKLSCMVYAMDWVEDTIWLIFRAINPCSDTTVRFWLKPSFYGVGEHGAQLADLNIVPNPNNGQMDLRFVNMDGKLSIRVYDMKGNQIDEFETVSLGEQTLHYDMHGRSSGIYFFVITSREGTVSKKVVIER